MIAWFDLLQIVISPFSNESGLGDDGEAEAFDLGDGFAGDYATVFDAVTGM